MPFDPGRATVRLLPGPPDAGPAPPAVSPSLTYEPFFGLKEKPFSLSADPRFLYRSPAHAPAFEELLTGIRRREGLIVLTGEIGTGKTTLIRSVLQHLDRRTFTAFVPDPFVSREDLLKMLLVDFGVVSLADLKRGSLAGASRPDLSYPLYEFLDSLVPLQAFAVLIIDEAQNLPLPLLEEIRILSDLEQREKLLQVVLVGQPELRSHLKLPEMRQVDQRVSVRCELVPLGLEDVAEYIRVRLNVAGGGECRVEFSREAIDLVFRGSGGVPRVINLICDRTLQRAHAARAFFIDSSLVKEAIKALGLDVPGRTPETAPAAVAPATAATAELKQAETAATPPVEPKAAEPGAAAAPPAHVDIPAPAPAVPARRVDSVPSSPQILSEFAAESDLLGRSSGRLALWRLAASLVMAALTAAAVAAFWYVYLTGGTIEASAPVLPPPPAWRTTGTQQPAPAVLTIENVPAANQAVERTARTPQLDAIYAIQVASFDSRARAERLLAELADQGFRARLVETDRGPAGLLIQIRIDGYRTFADAEHDLTRVREIPGYADAHLVAN
jgi:general secretion pathway protein A